jgi:hypothetical protein
MRKAAVLFLLLALVACGGGGDDSLPQTTFSIVNVEKTMTTFNRPSLMITIKNTGGDTGYNVSCDAHALDSTGKIIDTASAYFANLGNIEVAQSAIDEAVFFNLASHNDYASIDYDCTWLTRH